MPQEFFKVIKILVAQIRLELEIFWLIVARNKNLQAQGSLGLKIYWTGPVLSQKKWARPSPSVVCRKINLTKIVNINSNQKIISNQRALWDENFFQLVYIFDPFLCNWLMKNFLATKFPFFIPQKSLYLLFFSTKWFENDPGPTNLRNEKEL